MIVEYQHQTDVFNRFKNSDQAALFMETGTGKNRIMIRLAENHWQQKRINLVIVITTSALVMNWSMIELPMHSQVPYHTFIWKKSKQIRITPALYYLIVNVDAIPTKPFQTLWKEMRRLYPNYMLILDESTLCKSHDANRTQAVTFLARRAKVRCIASGTPITKSPLDVYAQLEILQYQKLGFKSWYSFKARYAEEKEDKMMRGTKLVSYKKIDGYKNMNELITKISNIAAIIDKKDCLDLPDKIYEVTHTEFTEEQARIYQDLVTKAVAYVDDTPITAINTIALINRLLQICSGQIKIGNEYKSIDTDRFEALKQYVEESDSPVIIWSSFVQSSINAATFLGPLALRIPAGLSPTALYAHLQQFKTGKVKSIIANPASLGHGITLVESAKVAYISNTFNLEHRLQSEDRNHRIGQHSAVLYTDFITKGSIEERVLMILRQKKDMARFILNKAKIKWLITGQFQPNYTRDNLVADLGAELEPWQMPIPLEPQSLRQSVRLA